MLPATQASLVSQMRVTYPPRGYPEGLEQYVRLEYGGNASAVRAMIARADGIRSAKTRKGVGRAILRALAKISDTFAMAGTPGSA